MTFGEQLFVVKHGNRSIVVHTVSKLLYFSFQVGAVNHTGSVPYAYEIQCFSIGSPAIIVYTRLESFGYISLFSTFQVHDTQPVAVALIAVAFHTLPCNTFSVGREFRIGIVAQILVRSIFLAEITSFTCFRIIKVNIRIGRYRIFQSCFLATSVSNLLGIVAPRQLLDTTERFHGRFIRFTFQNICSSTNLITVEWSDKRMRNIFHPFIPMLVHQVIDDLSAGFIQVRIYVRSTLSVFNLRDEQYFTFIRRKFKSFYTTFVRWKLFPFTSVGIHFPYLHTSACSCKKSNLASAFYPCRFNLAVGSMSKKQIVCAVGIHHINYSVALVLFYTVIRYGVCDLLSIGGYAWTSYASHCPQSLGSKFFVLDSDFLFAYNRLIGICRCIGVDITRCCKHHGCCHCHKVCFLHDYWTFVFSIHKVTNKMWYT